MKANTVVQLLYFDLSIAYHEIHQNVVRRSTENVNFRSLAMKIFKPEFWNGLDKKTVDNFDCRLFLDVYLLDEVFSADFHSHMPLGGRLGSLLK
jgi:hypothetical protein